MCLFGLACYTILQETILQVIVCQLMPSICGVPRFSLVMEMGREEMLSKILNMLIRIEL